MALLYNTTRNPFILNYKSRRKVFWNKALDALSIALGFDLSCVVCPLEVPSCEQRGNCLMRGLFWRRTCKLAHHWACALDVYIAKWKSCSFRSQVPSFWRSTYAKYRNFLRKNACYWCFYLVCLRF